MVCSNCGTENRPDRKFCLRCGAPLAIVCRNCGAPNEPESRFCGECGTPFQPKAVEPALADAEVEPKGRVAERRLVSVLFADLVGFTALSEDRDPEEVRDLLTRYFDTARETIGRYGGTVEKFIGDAVMAVWGTPVAHEDDAERAVRAALDLVAAIAGLGSKMDAPDLQLRAAVATGEAAVTIGAEGQGMVAGDLVNTTSRLQSVATPGTVLIGESTYLATRSSVAYEEGGEHALKGKDLPVKVWRALRVVAGRRGAKWTDALEPPFVGREEEFRQVKDLFHATAREGKPRLVSVMGLPGIGKSRLAWELFKYIDGLAETVAWHQGRSPAYGDGLTFWALGEMVRMRARIAEGDDAPSTLAKLDASLHDHVSDEDERRWLLPRLAHLLGIEQGVTGEREELFAAWRTFFERISERTPTVLVFEDIQWADPGLLDFIEHVLEWSRGRAILIVTLARPELMDRRPTWGAGQRNFTSLHLEPLPDAAIRELLIGLAPGLQETIVEQILDRAEGIPLYAVETIRMLVDQGHLLPEEGTYRLTGALDRLDIPDTLHALIAARLDVLDTADRTLLQDASILGKTFTLGSLAALTGEEAAILEPRLRSLVRKELLSFDIDARSPERGQYGFLQMLIREVAYQTLSKRDRRRRHLTAAHYFEGLADDELASVVATHYMEAYRATPRGPDAEALAARAQDALVAAAERATALGSHSQALAYLEQALAIITDPAQRPVLLDLAGEAAWKAAEFETAERYLRQAIERFGDLQDPVGSARATTTLSRVLINGGRVENALEALASAAAGLPAEDTGRVGADLRSETARAYMMHGEYQRAIETADQAAATAEAGLFIDILVDALVTKATSYDGVGRVLESIALLRGALALAKEHSILRPQIRGYFNLAFRLLRLDPRTAFEISRAGAELAARLGMREFQVGQTVAGCAAAYVLGEWEWEENALEEARWEELPDPLKIDLGFSAFELQAHRGDVSEAARIMTELERLVAESTNQTHQAMIGGFRAEDALARGDFAEAYARAMEMTSDPILWDFAFVYATRAALWGRDLERAQAAFARLKPPIPGTFQHASVGAARAGIAALSGRTDEALGGYLEAIDELRDLGIVLEVGLTSLEAVMLVGPDRAEMQAVAEEARAIFTRLGARPFLERLAEAVGTPQPA